jgi:hypothetical protein
MVFCSILSIRLASGWTAAISLLPVFYKNTAKKLCYGGKLTVNIESVC